MITFETVQHRLALAVRVDDHFTMQPASEELVVELDSREAPVKTADRASIRHPDGTYRFVMPVKPGARQVRVTGPRSFTWTATTPVVLPLTNPRTPLVIEVRPTASAPVPANTLAIRGCFRTSPPAAPVAIGQRVQIEIAGVAVRNRFTRCDEAGEFLFLVYGPAKPNAAHLIDLLVTAPGRTIASIDLVRGDLVTNVPGSTLPVPPGREIRALIHLN